MFLGNSLVSTLRSGVVIYSASSSVTIEGCVFDSNYHTTVSNRNTGGVLSADSSSVFLIKNSVFSNNTAGGEGGVLYSLGSSVVIQNSTFSKNIAGATSVSGSAVHFVADSVSRSLAIVSCSFSSNSFSGAKNANSAVIFVQLTGTSDATHTFGIASSSISTATSDLNSITLSGTASSAGTLVFYPFNTCIASLKVVSFTGSNYVLQNSGTRATATDMNSFCSTCKSVLSSSPFPESYYCSLLSSTIDCPLLKSTEVLNDCKSLSCAAPLFFEDIFCVSKCSEGMYAPVETGICVKNCPPASSNPSTLGYCSKCPTGLFYDPATKSCVTLDKCSASAPYGDPSTGYCIQSGLDCSTYLPVLDKDSKLCVAACQPSQFINTVDNSCQLCSSSVSCSFCVTSSDWNSFAALANSAASNSAICVRSPTLIRPPQATTVNIDSKTLQFISVLDSKANVVVTQSDTSTANTRSFILKNSDISIIGFTFSQLRCATEDGCVCNAQTSTKLLLKGYAISLVFYVVLFI